MPGTDSQEPADEMKEMFESIRHYIPVVVRQACGNLKYPPEPMELDGLEQRVALSLIENDYHTLRSFAHHSEPQTWLYTIAKRKVLERLREQKRMLNLEDVLLAAFTSQPDQEERLISEEEEKKREKILLAALGKLTPHERKLFSLMRRGLKADEVAKEMGITKRSAYTEMSDLKKKLRGIIEELMDNPDGIKDRA